MITRKCSWCFLQVASRVCKQLGHVCYTPELVCEGGALAFDGEGTVVTTESVLMDERRNLGKTRDVIEETLLSNLGAKKIIWLPEGVHGDTDTKGHVDNLVAFVRPGEVVLNWTDDEGDPQYPVSRKAEAILARETDAKGRKLRVHRSLSYFSYYASSFCSWFNPLGPMKQFKEAEII